MVSEASEHSNALYNFVLTDEGGKELYGTCLRFYDRYSEGNVGWDLTTVTEFQGGGRADQRQFLTVDSGRSETCTEDPEFVYLRKHPSVPITSRAAVDIPRYSYAGRSEFGLSSRPEAMLIPRCLVLLSPEPFLDTCKGLLLSLYTLTKNGPLYPFESMVMHLVMNIPVPNSQIDLKLDLERTEFRLTHPACNKLPLLDVNLGSLFSCLDLNNVLKAFRAILLERNVVLMSRFEEKLTDCSMGLMGLLYPFKWKLVFVPVLPTAWIDYMSSPVSFVMGVLAECKDEVLARCTGDELIVDLDQNTTTSACTLRLTQSTIDDLPDLPDHYGKKLIKKVSEILRQEICTPKSKPTRLLKPYLDLPACTRIRECFFQFFVSILKPYKQFLDYEGGQDGSNLFHKSAFLEICPESARTFFAKLLDTQIFAIFCDLRIRSSTIEQYYENLLFDEHITAKLNRSKFKYTKIKTPFLDDRSKDAKTVLQVPKLQTVFGLEPKLHLYERFPGFKYDLAASVGMPKIALPAVVKTQEEMPPQSPLVRRVSEQIRTLGIECVFLSWLQMWAKSLGCQFPTEQKDRLEELLGVLSDMQKRARRPTVTNFKLILEACLRVNPALTLPIFTFMNRINALVDSEILSILHKSVAKLHLSRKQNLRLDPPQTASVERIFTRPKDSHVLDKREVRFFVRERCYQCGGEFNIGDLMRLWQNDADMEWDCKTCGRNLTPDLQVRVGFEVGPLVQYPRTSTMEGVALFSPFQLKAKADSIDELKDLQALRTQENALFWNLVWHFHYLKLPYEFLLPYKVQQSPFQITVTEESPKTAVEPFAPERTHFSEVVRGLVKDAQTQTVAGPSTSSS